MDTGGGMASTRTLVLVRDAYALERLPSLIEGLPWAKGRGLMVDLLSGPPQQAMAERRELEGNIPIGVIAEDEPAALSLLAGGADEAVVMRSLDAQSLAAFVDRVAFRANVRAETQRLHEGFAHAEKLTALGTLVAGVGHEINNPLSAVMLLIEAGRRQLLPALDAAWELARLSESQEKVTSEELSRLRERIRPTRGPLHMERVFEELGSATDAIATIVRDLRVFARTDHEEPAELIAVPDLIDRTIRLLGGDLFKRCLLERDYASDLPNLVVPMNRVTQVLVNLLVNATHAISEVEREVHRVRISARSDDEFVAIAVSDTGIGIPPQDLERIFDPFFTTKRQDMGTGLGLSISRSIMRKLGGELSVESVTGEGATFICLLPIPTRDDMRHAFQRTVTTVRNARPQRSARVLVVDDDVHMLRSYARLLSAEHRMLVAHDGRDAIDLLESGSVADVAIVELDSDGEGLLTWLGQHQPDLLSRTLLVTTGASDENRAEFLRKYPGTVLHKPIRGEHLLETLAALLHPHDGKTT